MARRRNLAPTGRATAALARMAACAALLAAVAASPARLAAEEYLVGEGDVLQIGVFDHPDLTTSARVDAEQEIRLPLVGTLRVGGLTVSRIAELVTAKYADGYLIDPQVTVAIQEYRPRKVNLVGKVNRPGVYEFRGRMTLLDLLSRAGGLAADAGSRAAVTRRAAEGSAAVDLQALLVRGDTSLDIEIGDGDTIYVAEAGVFYLTGEVRRPGEYRHEEGMTLIRAITLAGGFTERAVSDRVTVIREEEGGRAQVLDLGAGTAALEAPVRRGDIIVVNVARPEFCYVTGEVKSAGAYRCDPDTTVLRAVTLAGGFTDAAAKGKIRVISRVDGREQVRERVGLEEPVRPDDVIIVPKSFF